MVLALRPGLDPWRFDIVVIHGHSHTATERGAVHRDEARGLLQRIAHGGYVDRVAFGSLTPEDQHIVRMRALTAVSASPIVFSHWSAAVLHGLPVMRQRLSTVHATVEVAAARSKKGVTGHVHAVQEQETVMIHDLRATGVGRTVVDAAGASPFEEGVMAADGALRAGVPRALLLQAVALAGARRASRRIGDVVAFAHPGAESAAESRFRVTMMRLGAEVPVLQFPILLADRRTVYLDALLAGSGVGVEVDGDQKYLDLEMATEGAARAVLAEKRREDEMRLQLTGLARIGWVQSGSTTLLRGVLGRLGVQATSPRRTMTDYAVVAALARPRFGSRSPRWRA